MAKHNVRIPAALWDDWQSELRWSLLILGMLATAGGQSWEEISEHCYRATRT